MNKAKNGIVKVGQTVRLSHPEDANIFEDFIVAAVNRTAAKDDVRVVPVKALFALRAVNAKDLEIQDEVEEAEAPARVMNAEVVTGKTAETVFSGERGGGKTAETVETEKLRDDGPSLEQYLKQGYQAEGYPPKGYAPKNSPGWQKLKKEREEAAKKLAEESSQAQS